MNTDLKGKFDGNCNRTACQQPIKGNNWFNTSTRAYYCQKCANGYHGINWWARRDDGIVTCIQVTDPNDRPPFPYEQMQKIREEKLARRQQQTSVK